MSSDAYVRGPDVLADLIMRAYGQTADDVQRRTAAVLTELRDDPSVARIVDAASSRASSEVAVEPEQSGDSYYRRKSWLE